MLGLLVGISEILGGWVSDTLPPPPSPPGGWVIMWAGFGLAPNALEELFCLFAAG